MGVADFQSLMLPLLRIVGDGKEHSPAEARALLGSDFKLTKAEQDERLPSGRQSRFVNRVAWAKVYLEQGRLLLSPRRGHFPISDRGHEVLKAPPARIDIKFLEQYPEFIEFRWPKTEAEEPSAPAMPEDPAEETPEVVYLQAKRWDGSVGRPEIQKFVGALHGKRAKKGVFITTGTFSSDAVAYIEHIDPRVVLVDGRRLAELIIDFEVGVTTPRIYHVKRVDSDYFEEG